MDTFKMKPKAALVSAAIVWLLTLGAAGIIAYFIVNSDADVLMILIMCIAPIMLAVPALSTTYGILVAGVRVADARVHVTSVVGFKRTDVDIDVSSITGVWHYRRSVAVNNRIQSGFGCGMVRADGATLHLDLTMYTTPQRVAFVEALRSQNPAITLLEDERDTGRVYQQNVAPVWEAPVGEAPRTKAAPAVQEEAFPQPQQAEESPADSAPKPVFYRYTAYEGDGSAKCYLCGARIASATTPGEHLTGGYLAQNGRKWVCKECWSRFADEYHWEESI